MYVVRTPGYRKRDQAMRWALPDRVFFACGACHILAHAFLERYGAESRRVVWIKPNTGFAGHHIVVESDGWAFDYHGYSRPGAIYSHHRARARRVWADWSGTLVLLPTSILLSEVHSRAFHPALWLREPGQFLHDALPRARRFLNRFPAPPA